MRSVWTDRLAEVWAPPGKAGSGVVLGEFGVLTARHVVQAVMDGSQTGQVLGRVIRRGAPPAWAPMRLVGGDAEWDLVVLHVDQEAREATSWVRPASASPVVATVSASSEPDCESVGFPDSEVHRPQLADPAGWVRQSEHLVGTLLPMGQAKPDASLRASLPVAWMPLDIATATPENYSGWRGMSGAGVTLKDGRLVGAAVAAESLHQRRRLYVVPLASALSRSIALSQAVVNVTGAPLAIEDRYAPIYRHLLYAKTLRTDGTPVSLEELQDLASVGVKPVDLPGDPRYLTYVPRDGDEELIQALNRASIARRMLLLIGDSGSGKTRAAVNALLQTCRSYRLMRPIEHNFIELVAEIPKLLDLGPSVVWLDDVEKYSHPAMTGSLEKLLEAGHIVVGTIRRGELEARSNDGEIRNPTGEALNDERVVQQLNWRREWSQPERDRVPSYVVNSLARRAVSEGVPLSVWAVAGPQLVRRLKLAIHDEDHPCRPALVRVLLDWYRTGQTAPIPQSEAARLVEETYVEESVSESEIIEALEWSMLPLSVGGKRGRHSLVRKVGDCVTVNDYIQENNLGQSLQPVPTATWVSALKHASQHQDNGNIWNVAHSAASSGQNDIAFIAWQAITLQVNDGADNLYAATTAAYNLGVLLQAEDPDAALAWFKLAVHYAALGVQPDFFGMYHPRAGEAKEIYCCAARGIGFLLGEHPAAAEWLQQAHSPPEEYEMLFNVAGLLKDQLPGVAADLSNMAHRQWKYAQRRKKMS
ncbi:hypothetical protein ELQ39_14420 [Streptomyces sp. GB4-14]|uniref:trypsin-like peptidase domain-containing protein n=1 Tax=Streptomyces sp. GB4-14 TaxID=2498703 RepID=UPI001F5F2EBC|nr:hypothetical protein [Streptomyces sp. GB4-14]